jgi:hypothetical protein
MDVEVCGYQVTSEDVKERCARVSPDEESPLGVTFGVFALADVYRAFGLESKIVTRNNGSQHLVSANCAICGIFNAKTITKREGLHILKCDPTKHAAYYDAF